MPITSGYGQGTSFTNVSGPSGMDVSPFLMALLQAEQRHLSNRAQTRGTVGPSAPAKIVTPMPSNNQRGGEGDRRGMLQEKLLKAQASKASTEAKALSSRMPTKTVSVGGSVFQAPDQFQMNAAQRKHFLPDNAVAPEAGMFHGTGQSTGPAQVYGGPFSQFSSPEEEEFEKWKFQQMLKAKK